MPVQISASAAAVSMHHVCADSHAAQITFVAVTYAIVKVTLKYQFRFMLKGQRLNDIALLNKSSQSYRVSLAIWNHTGGSVAECWTGDRKVAGLNLGPGIE